MSQKLQFTFIYEKGNSKTHYVQVSEDYNEFVVIEGIDYEFVLLLLFITIP